MTTNTKAIVKTEHSLIFLTSKGICYELTRVEIGQSHPYGEDKIIPVYPCYHQGVLRWVEGSEGLALSRFMNIIPNEIKEKLHKTKKEE